ncbi:unnamed protein product [Cylicocyclus nassatus]|uniref:Uncharacterized protein n=1 Tax=Cylicocyclus nassatus TaxID=53992 RepID=A0AA36DRM7_CYLNA|nr:unnamed protein product [Cylicocyclus nassatus]
MLSQITAVQDNGKNMSGSVKADTKVISRSSVNNVGFQSVTGFALGCGDSQAAFFKPIKTTCSLIYHFTIESKQVEDCVGTFSVGSWMGIISILIMLRDLMSVI